MENDIINVKNEVANTSNDIRKSKVIIRKGDSNYKEAFNILVNVIDFGGKLKEFKNSTTLIARIPVECMQDYANGKLKLKEFSDMSGKLPVLYDEDNHFAKQLRIVEGKDVSFVPVQEQLTHEMLKQLSNDIKEVKTLQQEQLAIVKDIQDTQVIDMIGDVKAGIELLLGSSSIKDKNVKNLQISDGNKLLVQSKNKLLDFIKMKSEKFEIIESNDKKLQDIFNDKPDYGRKVYADFELINRVFYYYMYTVKAVAYIRMINSSYEDGENVFKEERMKLANIDFSHLATIDNLFTIPETNQIYNYSIDYINSSLEQYKVQSLDYDSINIELDYNDLKKLSNDYSFVEKLKKVFVKRGN